MGKDYNENEDDKDSVSDVAGFLPDLVDGGILIDEGGFDVEEVFDKTVDIINAAADDLYDGAEDPRDGAEFGLADINLRIRVGGLVFAVVFSFLGVVGVL